MARAAELGRFVGGGLPGHHQRILFLIGLELVRPELVDSTVRSFRTYIRNNVND